jgi:hypothetical protein
VYPELFQSWRPSRRSHDDVSGRRRGAPTCYEISRLYASFQCVSPGGAAGCRLSAISGSIFVACLAVRRITPDKEHRPPHKCVANVNAMCAPSCTYPP